MPKFDRELAESFLPALRAAVSAVLEASLAEQERRMLEVSPQSLPLLEQAQVLLRGGKRLRPAFAYWGWLAGSGMELAGPDLDDERQRGIIVAASALEHLQAAALIHDDVMDASDTRRGNPSAHRALERLHEKSAWLGDSAAFGESAAIVLGDLLLSWSDELLRQAPLPAEALARGKEVFDAMRTELMTGQYLDLLEQVQGASTVESALRVAKYKSGRYSVERPLELGARIAGGDEDLVAALRAYGGPLGIAFQLRDDLLGVFGNPFATGKPVGDDLREGKRTVLVALAARSADEMQLKILQDGLGDPALEHAGVVALQQVLLDTGAVGELEAMIADLTAEAVCALGDVPGPAASVLRSLAVAATDRSH